MDWTAVGTILATGAVTFGSVWLKGKYDVRIERERLLAAEREKVTERQEAEDRSSAERERQAEEAFRQEGKSAVQGFGEILASFARTPDGEFFEPVATLWNERYDARARQIAESVSSRDARLDMIAVIWALSDFDAFALHYPFSSHGGLQAKILIRTLIELAGAVSRGESASESLTERVEKIRNTVRRALAFEQFQEERDQPR